MHRFFLPADALQGDAVVLSGEVAHQVGRVLRLATGDRLVALVAGRSLEVELEVVGKAEATARVVGAAPAAPALPGPVTLAQALVKGEKFEWVVQKATELGVAAIRPVVAERSVAVPPGDRLDRKVERWRAIAREAAEQCERLEVPEVLAPVPVAGLRGPGRLLVLDAREGVPLPEALPTSPGPLTLVVGPEGGLSPGELAALAAAGGIGVRIGPRVLRTETAGPAVLAMLGYRYELPG